MKRLTEEAFYGLDYFFSTNNPAPTAFFKRDVGARKLEGACILSTRTAARAGTHGKAKLLWYRQPDYLTTGTAATWAAEDGLHALAGHALLQMSKARINKIYGDLYVNSLERQTWAAALSDSLIARLKIFFVKKAGQLASAPKVLGPATARLKSFCTAKKTQR